MGINEIRALKQKALEPKSKKIYRIAKKSAKRIAKEKEQKEALGGGLTDIEQWFQDKMKNSIPVCENCGMEANWLLDPKYEKIWRACQAHILPKKKGAFPSVSTHPDNHMVLFPAWGGHLCGCHGVYDSNWCNATTMKIWETAVIRFKGFESKISPNERRKIPEQFLKSIQK